jgi:hypothetical protein
MAVRTGELPSDHISPPPAENFGLNWMLLLAWVGTMGDPAAMSPLSGLMRRRP